MDINNFYDSNDPRDNFKSPFKLNGRVVACSGYVFISMPDHGDYPQCHASDIGKFEAVMKLFADDRVFVPLPGNLVFPENHVCNHCKGSGKSTAIKCAECDGEGEVEFSNDHNEYYFECKSCDGDGQQVKEGGNGRCSNCAGTGGVYLSHNFVDVCGVHVNPKLLNYIINEPGIELSPDPAGRKLFFRANGCKGLIMGISL